MNQGLKKVMASAGMAFASMFVAGAALAEEAAAAAAPVPVLDSGSTAWMLTSTVLVLMMTIPGLALFYGGMVRKKNILATMMQSFAITALVSVLWVLVGYSLAFAEGTPYVGGLGKALLAGVEVASLTGVIPETVFIVFQMTFAIITPALITGAFADRMKFSSMLVFMGLWVLVVYAPVCHWVWGGGFLGKDGVLDYAGGTVVHINAGIAGLVAAVVLGPRKGFGTDNLAPANLSLAIIGASLLWVGWFGFNAGSAAAADGRAGMAMLVTQVAAAAATLGWIFAEWILRKKPSVLGAISGAVAGLVAITPASGFVGVGGALIIGAVAGVVCFWGATGLKHALKYDDSLDAFGVHGIGGIVGAILTGVFAVEAIGGTPGLLEGNAGQVLTQLYGIVATIVWSAVASFILLKVIDLVIGLRVTPDEEREGLDLSLHGESIH
ncbi:ammonium transport protein (Amt family) [Magnetospirillum gryphiswaldense MSR-1 v2]|uniref:Ammonium transporter n=1 Tax=Magnetospirillum gryphiswaldense (strain DSM 6361 / JCM 21280 / NBRC 15271 / MSR-1) TaxID=431944 RepID=V6F7Q1_MAGGM|nr:ammonium transporter [Magnetospirillum gryphiswaldense]CDL00513.1 ammonium transport protein (Amt family) [Magnetospirillum gryphiswaldense MSR-1 v2]